MKITTRSAYSVFFSLLISGGLVACGGDGDSSAVDAAGNSSDGDVAFVCDPVGANPGVGALLNAPLDSDVEVVMKTPQHPGNPGPLDLP
ncbi:MAG: hypothetical protein JKY56_13080 [Kofleriaceae bacterium]|nr:hypothetical protein [Kofleriaceae bacterium]